MVVVYAPTDVMFPFVVANRSGVTYLLGSMDIAPFDVMKFLIRMHFFLHLLKA